MKLLFRLTAAAVCALPLLGMSRCGTDAEPAAFSLPPATQTGANTFGFVLDGRVWRDYGYSCFGGRGPCGDNGAVVHTYFTSLGQYQIQAGLTTKQYSEHVFMGLVGAKQPGTYAWRSTTSSRNGAYLSFTTQEDQNTYHVQPGQGSLVVTRLDTVQRVIAGTFTGVVRLDSDTTKTFTITDGRFDLKLY